MARHPVSDECSVLPPFEKARNFGKIYTAELARLLGVQRGALVKFLRQRGLLHHSWLRPRGRGKATNWTTPRGAALAIAHFRAKQGALVLRGKDPFVQRDRDRAKTARQKARKAAVSVQAQLVGIARPTAALPELDE